MTEILTVAPEAFPGVTAQFEHLATTTGLTEHAEGISKENIEGKKLIILGAWSHEYYRALKRLEAYPVKVALLWTSPIGQVGFSPNFVEVSFLWLINDAIKSKMIDHLLIPTQRSFKAFSKIFEPGIIKYLPNTYDISGTMEKYSFDLKKGEDWVSLYSPFGTRKNLLNQVLAARLANVCLHLNGFPKPLQDFADLINLKYVDMGWMEKENYFRSIQTMKAGLKVSYSETFDYCLFDHMVFGVPCLTSYTTEWISKIEKYEPLFVQNFDDPNEIARKLKYIVEYHSRFGKLVKSLADKVAEKRNKISVETLKELIE